MSFNFVRLDIKTLKLARVHPEEDVLRYHPKVGHSATRAHSQLKTQQCRRALSTTIEMIGIAVAKARAQTWRPTVNWTLVSMWSQPSSMPAMKQCTVAAVPYGSCDDPC